MKKISSLISSVLFCTLIFAQTVPQGINYQAVARDAAGNELINQSLTIQFSIISDVSAGTISWQETHSVITNDYGLFTSIIGNGVSTGSGISGSFAIIDWSSSPHFLKVEIDDGGGYIDMGTTAFMSVPYALMAENISNPLWEKLGSTTQNTSTDKVVIETSTPHLSLEILDDVTGISIQDLDDNSEITIWAPGDGYTGGIGTKSQHDLVFYSANSTHLKLTTNGKFGVGNMSPSYDLDVTGDINFSGDLYKNGALFLSSPWSKSGNTVYYNSGNVGIGESSPSRKLEIKASNSNANGIKITNTDSGVEAIFDAVGSNTPQLQFGTLTNHPLKMYTNNEHRLTIKEDGDFYFSEKVGINTNTPNVNLQVAGTDDAELGSGTGLLVVGNISDLNLVIDGNEIIARDNGAASTLWLGRSGTVAVGTTPVPSGYKLAVDGKVVCEELTVKLSTNWPDYVFNSNYNLMSLKELQDYIKVNNHLPNIPPANEIENGGLEMGEMTRLLMEKIEELTLYMIDANNRIQELEDELQKNK